MTIQTNASSFNSFVLYIHVVDEMTIRLRRRPVRRPLFNVVEIDKVMHAYLPYVHVMYVVAIKVLIRLGSSSHALWKLHYVQSTEARGFVRMKLALAGVVDQSRL